MIGSRIKELRFQKGYSINELSEHSGVSKSYISYIERGIQKNPSLYILWRIANSLDTTVEDLIDNAKPIDQSDEGIIDEEWVRLFTELIEHGITKREFSLYLDFIKFKKTEP